MLTNLNLSTEFYRIIELATLGFSNKSLNSARILIIMIVIAISI